jgi:protein gp37
MARRLQAMGVRGYEEGFSLALHPERLNQPLQREKPTMYFVNSMSDLFHENIPDSFLKEVFHIMGSTPHHTFQVLTKREARMIEFTELNEMPNNVWLGVTVEDRRHGIPRISALRRVKAPIRFLSIEPLLEDLGDIDLTDIHWVIVGGESGPKARIMQPEWVLRIKQQCQEQKVPFFFKQWGAWGPDGKKRNKKANGRLLLGRTWDDRPL